MILLIDVIIGFTVGAIIGGVTGKGINDWEFWVLIITFTMMTLAFHLNHDR